MRLPILYLGVFLVLLTCLFLRNSQAGSGTPESHIRFFNDSAYDVFLVAGQSNTYYGIGYNSILDKPATGIYQLGRIAPNDMKIIEAKEPIQHFNPKSDRIGFALTFAKEYQKYFHDQRKILIVPCGMDNTGFEGDGWNKGNFLYEDAIKRINYVMEHFNKSKLIAILWHQGEKDIGYKQYQKSLDSLIVFFRKDIIGATGKTPFILGGMVPFWVKKNSLRQKQQKIIMDTKKRLPYIGYADPYLPFKITKPDNTIDTVHYNAVGQREIGKRYFEAFKKFLKN